MEIPVLVEPVAHNGFRAICGEPLRLETEGPTREAALERMQQLIQRRIADGAIVVAVPLEPAPHPLARFAGTLKGEPLLEPWKQAMADYRAKSDDSVKLP